jgi:catechol 2,3-dioxygenase-like lactoylglutathione lyase family enzyme
LTVTVSRSSGSPTLADGEQGDTVPTALPGVGDIVTAVGSMNHLAFHVPAEKFDEYRQRLISKGVEVGPVLNHDDSPSQVAKKLYPGVFIRSFHFTDPDGIMLEFACWTEQFTDGENAAVPKTSADRRPRHVVAH